jgi:uncharacterized membrane protein
MKINSSMLALAIGGLVTLGAAQAMAADAAMDDTEKCYGVVKAGMNDCATAAHQCAGHSTKAGKGEWVKLPKGTCARLSGASLEAPMMDKPMMDKMKK